MGIIKDFGKIKINSNNLKLLVVIYFVISLLTLAQPEVLRRSIAAVSDRNMSAMVTALIMAVTAALLYCVISFGKDIFLKKTQNALEKQFAARMFHQLVNTKMKELQKKEFGDVSTTIIRNTELLVTSATNSVYELSCGCFKLLLVFTYMCLIQWQLALCILLYNIIIRIFAVFVERKIKKNAAAASEAMKESGNTLTALLKNMLMVRIYSNKDFFLNKVRKKEKAVLNTAWKSFVWLNGFQDFIWAFSKLAEFIIVYGVGSILIINGVSNISILMTFVFANDLFTIGINHISNYIAAKAEYLAYRDSIMEILDEREIEAEDAYDFEDGIKTIRFENVCFGYGDKTILKNVNFQINKGEKILLVGGNGQGKSTILKLICGLYRPLRGTIYFNQKDSSEINISSISKKCGYISQKSNILEGNIAENIALSKDIIPERSRQVLKSLNLENCVGTPPDSLSTGERQRVNIGRTLYRDGVDVVLCDEIFSNVDKENRQAVIDALFEKFSDTTIIMVSHEKINYHFDRVLQVDQGSVTEVAL